LPTKSELANFLNARDLLLRYRTDYLQAYQHFSWPSLQYFNWASDYFDRLARNNSNTALWIVNEDGTERRFTFEEMSRRSSQTAAFLLKHGVRPGTRILMMLPNTVAIWEIMLAAMKIGAVLVPVSTLLTAEELRDRVLRSSVTHIVTDMERSSRFADIGGAQTRIMAEGTMTGWIDYTEAYDEQPAALSGEAAIPINSPYLLYFTSGTTSQPKLVVHSRESYPVGHLATMYWIGLQPGDLHMNISSPGWAKHAWSSFFAPWNAGATIFVYNYNRFDPKKTLDTIARYGVSTLCAPPTVWRILIQQPLASYSVSLREIVSAGEPLNPEVIAQVRSAWGITIRDGYGQTETVATIGNCPGQTVQEGFMGKPTPGHKILLVAVDGREGQEGEICLSRDSKPHSLMTGYLTGQLDDEQSAGSGLYRTGDIARKDEGGCFNYIGRVDDVFKSSDYRISPFELESVLLECPLVAEAAVVPSRDAKRGDVPKAFLLLAPGAEASRANAREIFRFIRSRIAPFKRIRRIEFRDLPKTISGKIRRAELRRIEATGEITSRAANEFCEEDFPELQ